jgi:hypothetical protein
MMGVRTFPLQDCGNVYASRASFGPRPRHLIDIAVHTNNGDHAGSDA